jgi:hypothetical protein
VHEPIVVSVAARTPTGLRGLAVTLVVGVALSLAAAVVFFRVAERPSHRLSAWVGRLVQRRAAGRPMVLPATMGRTPEDLAFERLVNEQLVPARRDPASVNTVQFAAPGPRTEQRAWALTPPPRRELGDPPRVRQTSGV